MCLGRVCYSLSSTTAHTREMGHLLQVSAPEHIRAAGYDTVQFTLVDCPGHASLIRTIIGGAQVPVILRSYAAAC